MTETPSNNMEERIIENFGENKTNEVIIVEEERKEKEKETEMEIENTENIIIQEDAGFSLLFLKKYF